jgi:hypothetical protein
MDLEEEEEEKDDRIRTYLLRLRLRRHPLIDPKSINYCRIAIITSDIFGSFA